MRPRRKMSSNANKSFPNLCIELCLTISSTFRHVFSALKTKMISCIFQRNTWSPILPEVFKIHTILFQVATDYSAVFHLLCQDILLRWLQQCTTHRNLKHQQLKQAPKFSLSLLSSGRLQSSIPWHTTQESRLYSSFWRALSQNKQSYRI